VSHTNCVFCGDAFRYMTDISMCPRDYENAGISSQVTIVTKIAIDLTCTGTAAVYKHEVRKMTLVNIHGRQFMYRRCKHIHTKLKK
jgi:hypothetical protein